MITTRHTVVGHGSLGVAAGFGHGGVVLHRRFTGSDFAIGLPGSDHPAFALLDVAFVSDLVLAGEILLYAQFRPAVAGAGFASTGTAFL